VEEEEEVTQDLVEQEVTQDLVEQVDTQDVVEPEDILGQVVEVGIVDMEVLPDMEEVVDMGEQVLVAPVLGIVLVLLRQVLVGPLPHHSADILLPVQHPVVDPSGLREAILLHSLDRAKEGTVLHRLLAPPITLDIVRHPSQLVTTVVMLHLLRMTILLITDPPMVKRFLSNHNFPSFSLMYINTIYCDVKCYMCSMS